MFTVLLILLLSYLLFSYIRLSGDSGGRRFHEELYISYILYIFVDAKNDVMDTAIKITKRKVIDIPEDIFRYLSVKAAMQGTNLKKYIEGLLAKDVEDMVAGMDDNEAYQWLSRNEPDGHVRVGEKEKRDFENWLGIERE